MLAVSLLLLAFVVEGQIEVLAENALDDYMEDDEEMATENPWNIFEGSDENGMMDYTDDGAKRLLESLKMKKSSSREVNTSFHTSADKSDEIDNIESLSDRRRRDGAFSDLMAEKSSHHIRDDEGEAEAWILDSERVPENLLGGEGNDGLAGIVRTPYDPTTKGANKRVRRVSENIAKRQAAPWLMDSEKVPDDLQGSETNDGLAGISGGPASPVDVTGKPGVPWYDIFQASAIPDTEDADSQTPPSDSFDQSIAPGNAQDDFLPQPPENNQPDAADSINQPPSSPGQNDSPSLSSGEVEEMPSSDEAVSSCTCVSLTQCGATFRSDSSLREGEQCPDGEVFCCNPSLATTTRPLASPPAPLHCGQSRPVRNIQAPPSQPVPVSDFAEFPWTVLLTTSMSTSNSEDNGMWKYRCGGSLVHSLVVLTAAHCLDDIDVSSLIIVAGDWDLDREDYEPLPSQTRVVESVTIHPAYRKGHPPNDIALLKLNESFNMADNVNTVCLPSSTDELDEALCVATGWGKSPSRVEQVVMKKVPMPIVSRDSCQGALRKTRLGRFFILDNSFICAGGEGGKDVCKGDGGGPLTCPSKSSGALIQVGIISWGINCGDPVPGVFSDVKKLSGWIEQTLASFVS